MTYLQTVTLIVATLAITAEGRSVNGTPEGHCQNVLHGRCVSWRRHASCPQERQHLRRTTGCDDSEFCCTGAPRTLRPRPQRHWYGQCGISNAAPGDYEEVSSPTEQMGIARHGAYIIGGQEAVHGQFPWQASILVNGEHSCGGTLLDDQFVLTAAHCVGNLAAAHEIILGSIHMMGGDDTALHVAASSIHVHPGYGGEGTYADDIALIKLSRSVAEEIASRSNIMPACPPNLDTDYTDGHVGVVAGWGKTSYPISAKSTVLRYADVPIINTGTCCAYHCENACSSSTCLVQEYNICAGYEEGGVDACAGDSGGPMGVYEEGVFHLVGVVSWGNKCAQEMLPGVYIDVKYFMAWIDSVLEGYG